jgi:hypothetical protein
VKPKEVIHSSQYSKHAKELVKPLSNVANVCVPNKECSYTNLYKLLPHIGTQVGVGLSKGICGLQI